MSEDVTAVDTDTGDAGAVDTAAETILNGGAPEGDAGKESGADANAAADDAGAEGTGEAGAEGTDTPPDTYADFAMPEGMTVDETVLAEATPVFKEFGLNQEQAQKLIDLYAGQAQAGSQKQIDDFNQLRGDWLDQSKNDSEYGGDAFDENAKLAQAAVSKYGTPEFKQLLEDYGIGNHPEMIRFMVRTGATLKEDVPGSAGAQSTEKKDRVSILYPNS